ncbi:MAG: hypothetical protein HY722_01140 [Planctomycetes bacterium]|nr:hypothetical protein [Planctomycetota bacterium]
MDPGNRSFDGLETADLYRRAYAAYEHLSSHARELEGVSSTARLLALSDAAHPGRRAQEEARELAGCLRGTHEGPLLQEAVQVWYWLALVQVLLGEPYEALAAHEHLEAGFERPDPQALEVALELEGAAPSDPTALLEAVGAALACHRGLTGEAVSPRALILADLASMRTRPYLAGPLGLADPGNTPLVDRGS